MIRPTLITREIVIKKKVWDCGISEHGHLSAKVAQACLDKQNKPKVVPLSIDERGLQRIHWMETYMTGRTLQRVATQYNAPVDKVRFELRMVMKELRQHYGRLHPKQPKFRRPFYLHSFGEAFKHPEEIGKLLGVIKERRLHLIHAAKQFDLKTEKGQ